MDYRDEPIAIIGIASKLPGDATNVEKFWKMLLARTSARSDPPPERFNVGSFGPEIANNGKGHYLKESVQAFDAPFFSISASEARSMDPIHRLTLEVVYQALENSGLTLERIAGSKSAVFLTAPACDYDRLLSHDLVKPRTMATGVSLSILANRVSWFFDLKGQSCTLDSACSSSLVALHLACQSIASGEALMCIVAAGSLCLDPQTTSMLSDLNCLSPDGISYSFDSRANGFSRGEGVSAVILKPYSKAVADGDTVRAVIRATNVTHNGHTAIMTHTSVTAQEELIKSTYEASELAVDETRYIEAHGTGTRVGDPNEAHAIVDSLRPNAASGALYVGAVKTNIGHLEGASGLASLIKTILILEKAIIPPNAWYERLNPKIPDDTPLKFPTTSVPWPDPGLRRASVNAFGLGGSNAHAIVEDALSHSVMKGQTIKHATRKTPPKPSELSDGILGSSNDECDASSNLGELVEQLFVFSASDSKGLDRVVASYVEHFRNVTDKTDQRTYLENLAWTLFSKRDRFLWRFSTVACSLDGLCHALTTNSLEATRSQHRPVIGAIFSGQGSQWQGMTHGLLAFEPFKTSLTMADEFLSTLGCEWSILEELERSGDWIVDHPLYSQPVTTAIQIGLTDLLFQWGFVPAFTLGHSSGEIAAAYCSGAISRESAWQIAYYRGLATASLLKSPGQQCAMLSVGLPADTVQVYVANLAPLSGFLDIACYNSPNSTTISGASNDVERLESSLGRNGIFVRRLKIPLAYHSRQMQSIAELYRLTMRQVQPGSRSLPHIPMVSSVTGSLVSHQTLQTSRYWIDNLTSPVVFSKALSYIASESLSSGESKIAKPPKLTHFLEIGPHASMKGPIEDFLRTSSSLSDISYSSMLTRHREPRKTVLEAAGQLHCIGCSLDLFSPSQAFYRSDGYQMLVDLPPYPFDHSKKYWGLGPIGRSYLGRPAPRHSLLGTPVKDWNRVSPRWEHCIKLSEHPWIEDHKINDDILYPAAGMVVMAIEAIRQLLGPDGRVRKYCVQDVQIGRALRVPQSDEGVGTSTQLRQTDSGKIPYQKSFEFSILSFEGDTWVENCRGQVAAQISSDELWQIDNSVDKKFNESTAARYEEFSRHCTGTIDPASFYDFIGEQGMQYGPCFRTLRDIQWNRISEEAMATTNLLEWKRFASDTDSHLIHPSALDTTLQVVLTAIYQGGSKRLPSIVPTRINSMDIFPEAIAQSTNESERLDIAMLAKSKYRGFRNIHADVTALNTRTQHQCITASLECTFVEGFLESDSTTSKSQRLCHHLMWKPDVDLEKKWIASSLGQLADSPLPLNQECFKAICIGLQYVSKYAGPLPQEQDHLRNHISWAQAALRNMDEQLSRTMQEESSALRLDEPAGEILYKKVESQDGAGRMIAKVLRALPDILSGKVSALSVFFDEEQLVSKYYQYMHDTSSGFQGALRYLELLAHKRPQLRILEVGAGTGGATRGILDALMCNESRDTQSPYSPEYVFTDISPEFFHKAKSIFSKYLQGRMEFATFDIERDPSQQGFDECSFDLIVASNVVHATESINVSLQNLGKLLKRSCTHLAKVAHQLTQNRNGKLLLGEKTTANVLSTFLFGLLPGWWKGVAEGRTSGPMMSRPQWDTELLDAGFSGVDICMPLTEGYDKFSVIIATKKENQSRNGDPNGSTSSIPASTNGISVHTNGTISSELCPSIRIVVTKSTYLAELADSLKNTLETTLDLTCDIVDLHSLVESHADVKTTIVLPEIEHPVLSGVTEIDQESCRNIVQSSTNVLWVYAKPEIHDPRRALVQGLFRSLYNEYGDKVFVSLALTSVNDADVASNTIRRVIALLESEIDETEPEYVETDSRLEIPRAIPANYLDQEVASSNNKGTPQLTSLSDHRPEPMKLTMQTPGLFDSFVWTDHDLSDNVPPDCVDIDVGVIGLNFRDVLVARGHGVGAGLGLDCSGTVSRAGKNTQFRKGDSVACMVDGGAFATRVRCEADYVVHLPDNMSFEDGAAFPTIYYTAFAALVTFGRIQHGDSVLIHSAAGGLGQACIQLARLYTSEIFVTVGNVDKKAFLCKQYGIPEDHVMLNKSSSFSDEIMALTNGHGVDIIVNSLPGEALKATWDCIASFGRFLEVGKADILESSRLPMLPFSKGASFIGIDLVNIRSNTKLFNDIAASTVDLVSNGSISLPVPLRVYQASEVVDAFRMLESGKSVGKVLVRLNNEDKVMVAPSPPTKTQFNADYTYVVAGGFGGLGRAICYWMVEQGARNLLVLSRQVKPDPKVETMLSDIRARGVTIAHPPCNIGDGASLKAALNSCDGMPPIKGCIHSSMVLKDKLYTSMTAADFHVALNPKVAGTWNLHSQLPGDLDFFILLSSVSGVIGLGGQANYACGNTYQDALARYRVARGLKAVSLNLCNIDRIGAVAEWWASQPVGSGAIPPEVMTVRQLFDSRGLATLSEHELLALLNHYCNAQLPLLTPDFVQVMIGLQPENVHRVKNAKFPRWVKRPLFGTLFSGAPERRVEPTPVGTEDIKSADEHLPTTLREADTIEKALEAVSGGIQQRLARSLAIGARDIDTRRAIHSYGIDSLSAVEIVSWFSKFVGAHISAVDVLSPRPVEEIARNAVARSKFVKEEIRQAAGAEGCHEDSREGM